MPGWVVVKFMDENLVEVVPYNWLRTENNRDQCLWPNYNKKSNVVDAILNKVAPTKEWKLCANVQKCSSKIYTNFDEANRKASRAKYNFDLSASEERSQGTEIRKRILKKPSRFASSSSEDSHSSCDFPVAPTGSFHEIDETTPVIIEEVDEISNVITQLTSIDERITVAHGDNAPAQQPTSICQGSLHTHTLHEVKSRNAMTNQPQQMSSSAFAVTLPQEDFQKQCLRELAILNVRLRDLTDFIHAHIGNIDVHKGVEESVTANDLFKDTIPIKTLDMLSNAEDLLLTSDYKEKLVKRVAHIGGNNLKDVIKRILSALIADDVVVNYSLVGGKGKKKFKLLRLYEVVFDAARCSAFSKHSTDKDIEIIIAAWLSKATERLKKIK